MKKFNRSEERRVGKESGSEGLIHIFVPHDHTKNADTGLVW